MISKELLSEVLEIGIEKVGHNTKDNNLYYSFSPSSTQHINIYELANKCKEWAIKQDYGYIINSCTKNTNGCAQVEWYEKNHSDKHGTYREHTFYSEWFKADNNNEPEAIFKACQWILENKELK